MKIANVLQLLEKIVAKTSQKRSTDNELVVVEWISTGVLLLHLDVSSSPKILRFLRAQFDESMTDADKRAACAQFLSAISAKQRPKAVLCWADGMTFRQFTFPEMPQEDLLKALDWDLKKKYFFNSQENLMGFKESASVEGQEGPEKLYSVFYCENRIALPRLDEIFTQGLEVQAIIPSQAALAYFTSNETIPEKDLLICDFQEDVVRIVVARQERTMLVRNVALAVSDSLFTDESLGRVAEEVRKTIEFYESQKYAHPVGKAVFTGTRCEPARILDFMTTKLNVPVTVPSLERFITGSLDQTDKDLLLSQPGVFAVALGAAMAADDTLNLVPIEIKNKNRLGKLNRLLNLGLVVFGCLLLAVLGLTTLNMSWTKSQVDVLEKEFVKLNENKKVLEDMLMRSRIRRVTLNGDIPVYALLKELTLRTPGTIVIRQLQYNRADMTLMITGEVPDAKRESSKSVTQFTTSLAESNFFSKASLTSSNQDDERKALTFQVDAVTKGLSV